jgi:hypothetical protein
MFKKILIANRGEIALRIIRTCKEMGIKTVAVYSTADADSLHVKFADEAVCIGPPPGKESYLKIQSILAAAEITNAEAIHPGYGFLSENAEFSKICGVYGIKFIGADPDMISKMGDKATAKATMKAAGVPTIPGSEGILESIEEGKKIAKDYPDIEFQDLIVDNMAMQMVMRPQQFDVVVTTNLFGDILSDLASGLVGGLGVTGAANIGDDAAIFEAVHGSAPDIVGKNIANPMALLFSALMMLEHIDQKQVAENIRKAIYKTLVEKKVYCTPDIGGEGTTSTFTQAVCDNI